jgi:hypothetical protein
MTGASSPEVPAAGREPQRLTLVPAGDPAQSPVAEIGILALVRFAREVWGSEDPAERMRRGVALAVDLVDGCDHAVLTLAARGSLQVGAASDDVARQADELQLELTEGPSVDALRTRATVASQDLVREPRWGTWCRRAVDRLGLRGSVSVLLSDAAHTYGSLSLYAGRGEGEAWSGQALQTAEVLASHLTLALGDALQMEHRTRAMASRTVIGQAEGILMERYDLTEATAYAVLLRVSHQDHVKLGVVAADLVRTGRLPGSTGIDRTPPVPA